MNNFFHKNISWLISKITYLRLDIATTYLFAFLLFLIVSYLTFTDIFFKFQGICLVLMLLLILNIILIGHPFIKYHKLTNTIIFKIIHSLLYCIFLIIFIMLLIDVICYNMQNYVLVNTEDIMCFWSLIQEKYNEIIIAENATNENIILDNNTKNPYDYVKWVLVLFTIFFIVIYFDQIFNIFMEYISSSEGLGTLESFLTTKSLGECIFLLNNLLRSGNAIYLDTETLLLIKNWLLGEIEKTQDSIIIESLTDFLKIVIELLSKVK